MSKFAVILAAAGKSSRFNAKSNPFAGGLRTKPFVALNGRAVWLYSAERFALRKDVAEIVLVVSPEDRREVEDRYAMEILLNRVKVVEGGAERYLSVQNALAAVSPDVDYVAVHDAARPCITDG
ncbi:MAG: 2-C-methyl-D-erythritol 4-phosphate cytidylyltransferase, partial [Thermoguttaceae bacterium]|nr:2-C-methyl-D-erythritol 4-phosphate cytidylyltransferase [Thermoguttaceae bacterium]